MPRKAALKGADGDFLFVGLALGTDMRKAHDTFEASDDEQEIEEADDDQNK